MFFRKRKGFVLISTMLIVLMLSIIASEMSKAFFLDLRKEGYLSFDAIAFSKRIAVSYTHLTLPTSQYV